MNKCLNCQKDVSTTPNSYGKKFCSLSCSTTYRNILVTNKRKEAYSKNPSKCIVCYNILSYNKRKNKFCSHSCSATSTNSRRDKKVKVKYNHNEVLIEKLLNGSLHYRPSIRKAITLVRGYKCEKCQINEWNGSVITLQVDHVDGNAGNNNADNLRLLCPNCHSQTHTFGGRNKGNGRKSKGLKLS